MLAPTSLGVTKTAVDNTQLARGYHEVSTCSGSEVLPSMFESCRVRSVGMHVRVFIVPLFEIELARRLRIGERSMRTVGRGPCCTVCTIFMLEYSEGTGRRSCPNFSHRICMAKCLEVPVLTVFLPFFSSPLEPVRWTHCTVCIVTDLTVWYGVRHASCESRHRHGRTDGLATGTGGGGMSRTAGNP